MALLLLGYGLYQFYLLAKKLGRPWGYFIIAAIAIFYGTQLVLGFLIGIFGELLSWEWYYEFVNSDSGSSAELIINVVGIIIGGLALVAFYQILKRRIKPASGEGFLDSNLSED